MIGFISPFKILEHLESLTVVRETSSEYHCTCPVCGDGGFKVSKTNGKYQAFKCGCDLKDIREAISPWSQVKAERGFTLLRGQAPRFGGHSSKVIRQKKVSKHLPEGEISLAQLPEIPKDVPEPNKETVIPEWLQNQGVPANALETRYWYSKSRWVSRFEWSTPDGQEKTIRQGHIKSNGLIQWKKGSKDWKAYKLSEAIANSLDKWILGVEGEGCVETARELAIAAITWQGSNWNQTAIANDLKELKQAGAKGLVYFPDHDEAGSKKAELVLSACESIDFPCLILSPTDVWAQMPPKGDITDWVKSNPLISTGELTKRLEMAVAIAVEERKQQKLTREQAEKEQEILSNIPNWTQSNIAAYLAEKYRSKLAWNTDVREWYHYSSQIEGIWSVELVEFVGQLVIRELDAIAKTIASTSKNKKEPSYTSNFVNGVIAILKMNLAVREWNEAFGLLPLLNGVLILKNKQLIPHSPEHKLTWCLPYDYNPLATCDPIKEWLLSMCGGDRQLLELMRAYLLGIVLGKADWQKFVELIGPGGTGKSTFTRLAVALVGEENVHTTTLMKLEKEKFETACLVGKKLVVIPDSEKYVGAVGRLKNLTGKDPIPLEEKFKQSRGTFTSNAMVIVSANEPIQSDDYTSGLARRRISIPMVKKIKEAKQKQLLDFDNGKMKGKFVPHIPGLLNWVLSIDEESATTIVKDYENQVPSLALMKAEILVSTNPLADWLDNKVVFEATAQTNIGLAKRDKDGGSNTWYLNTDKWLYASYAEYCHNTGNRAMGLRRFVNLLSDLGQNQLGLEISRGRDRFGSYIMGLKLRTEMDSSPLMITGNSAVTKVISNPPTKSFSNTDSYARRETQGSLQEGFPRQAKLPSPQYCPTNVITKVWNMVMERVMDVVDMVMDESLDSDECDGYDAQLEKSKELEPNQENQLKSTTEKAAELEISVGEKVTLKDCPGHWHWASPFKVEAMGGNLVKLEMIDELIEINRLQKWAK